MMIEQTKTKSFQIVGAPKLDPISVVLRDIGAGKGELIVTCYGLAWTAYWGAMGERSVEEFVRSVSADYVANRMWIPHERRVKNRYAYLVRIIEAVQAALKMPSEQIPIDPVTNDSDLFVKESREAWFARLARISAETTPKKAIDAPGYVKPDTTERVHFYEQEFYVLSNFSAFNVQWSRQIFATSEHAYHWAKFPPLTRDEKGTYVRDAILNAPSAHEAFKLAERWKILRRPDWDEVKVGVMREILRAKVERHEYVRRKLMETGDRELVEDSWRDDFWGWGPQREGKNMLGKLWMEIRAELRSEIEEQARRVE